MEAVKPGGGWGVGGVNVSNRSAGRYYSQCGLLNREPAVGFPWQRRPQNNRTLLL